MPSSSVFVAACCSTIALIGAASAADSAELALAVAAESAGDAPLDKLPYTPGLDTAAMDRTADPCVDFYQYTCGGWRVRNPIPPDQPNWSVYAKLYRDNQRYLWGILASLSQASAERSPSQQKIGDYFAACMDESTVERLGMQPLAPMLARIEGLRSREELPALLAQLHSQTGAPGFFFSFRSGQDFADATQVIAFASAGGLGLPDRDYYTDTGQRALALRTQYQQHVRRVFELLGDSPASAAANAAVVLRLETALARVALTRVERRDPKRLFHPFDRRTLQALTPGFDWTGYLQALGLNAVSQVNVTEPRFYRAWGQLLRQTSLEQLKTYLRWHAAHSASPYLSKAFVDQRFTFFQQTLRGVAVQQPRWQRCVEQVDALLGEALGQEFVARTFGPQIKTATLLMAMQIEQAMRADIENLSWMSEPTKHQALLKLDAIVNKVGYPDRWRDYGPIEVRRDDYFGDMVRATEFESRRDLAKIGKPLDRTEWQMTPPTVNAYYDQQMNDINFPAGVLQPPLYDPAMDDAPNYGNTGGTIGHELTHAFDDEGRQFDAHGNLKDWWTIADAQKFKQRAQCIVDQYAQYVIVDDIHINSHLTLGEDVADLGGLILAHMAWRAQSAAQKLEDRDGLTPEQRFFVGYAQWACENDRPEDQRLLAKTDPHSPGRYRVNGLVVNMPEFEHAFSCKAGQPMVKEPRCRVW